MGNLKIIIGAIEEKIDKCIADVNHKEYDGMSNYYYYLNQDMPHIISGLYFVVKLLHETKSLTDAQAEYLNEKIKTINH